MTLFRKCLWCGVRRGSICAAISSMIYFIFVFICAFFLYKENKNEDSAKNMMWLCYVTFVFSTMIFMASMLVIRGILDDRRDSRMLLMPFIVVISIFDAIQFVGWIQIIDMKVPIWIILYLVNIFFCLFVDLCVISQYQELKDGRGTKDSNITEEPPPMYIAVSDRMTLPFSREGSEGAAMYTTRVPSPIINQDESLNIGSKSVEPTRRWTPIDYEYSARPQSSAAGSYVQNLYQQDAASTHTESTFFFAMNSTGGMEQQNDQEADPLAIVPSAPSENGAYMPIGRALSYPSTPANNTPYLSSTLNRRPMVETRNSSRSLSHLEAAGNQQQTTEYFGVKRMTLPPQYHTISTKEHYKVESIV